MADDLRSSGSHRPRFAAAVALLVALFVLHQDVWLWDNSRVALGLPVGLAYHVGFCLAVTLALLLAVRWSWPREVPADEQHDGEERR